MQRQDCGVQFQDLYTSGAYAAKHPSWHVEESPWKAKEILRLMRRHRLAPRTVCEVGCGAGEVLKQLQEKMDSACFFVGYEISPHAFELCQTRANERLQFKLADITKGSDGGFDLLLVLDVIEHLEDYFSFLRALKQKSTYKVFHIPLDISVQAVLRPYGLIKRREEHAHIHYFTKETALHTLSDIAYEVIDYRYAPRSNEIGPERIQRLLRWPRSLWFAIHKDTAQRILGGYSLFVLAK
jgi:cyclopropane fatty-acyl-phospholipid synthase-like methyltransferase